MKLIYCDASFSYQKYEKLSKEIVLKGLICVAWDDFQKIEQVGVGRVEGLKQYINIFELIAIARSIELAIEYKLNEDITIHTDSTTAKSWASKNRINAKRYTTAHDSALSYIRDMVAHYPNKIIIKHVLRDNNPAGKILEIEVENKKA